MENFVKIIHAADLHIGAEFSFLDENKRKLRKSEARLTLEKIFNICKTNEIDFLLLAGDVFENNAVNSADIKAFLNGIEAIPETQVIAATGNHDPLTTDSPYFSGPLPKNFHIIDSENTKIDFDDKNCSIYGSAFLGCYKEPQGPIKFNIDFGRINIAVIHGDIQQGSKYNYISREFLANSGMDYIALGHIHTHTDVQKIGNTNYAYSGCIEPHGFDETGEMGVIAAKIGKAQSDFNFVPVCARRHEIVTVDVNGKTTNAEIAECIVDSLKFHYGDSYGKNLYKIILTGFVSEQLCIDKAEIINRLADSVFFVKIKDETAVEINIDLLSREKSLKGEFVRVMLEKMQADPQNEALKDALNLGLKAFSGEVKYDEDK